MKWILILISLSVTDDICTSPFPLIKHTDQIFDSQEECELSFRNSKFYKTHIKQEIVGFCVGPIKPMYLNPQQLVDRSEHPKCP